MAERYPSKRAYATGKLYKTLRKYNAYKSFVANIKKENKKRINCGLTEFRGLKELIDLQDAFHWTETKEGHAYWSNLCNGGFDEQT